MNLSNMAPALQTPPFFSYNTLYNTIMIWSSQQYVQTQFISQN